MYSVKCGGCEKEYISKTARTLGVRIKEHTANSAITDHTSSSGHKYTFVDAKVLLKVDGDF